MGAGRGTNRYTQGMSASTNNSINLVRWSILALTLRMLTVKHWNDFRDRERGGGGGQS